MRTGIVEPAVDGLRMMFDDLHYVNLLVPHVLSRRERDTLLAAWELDDRALSEERLYRTLGARLNVAPGTAKRYLTAARKNLQSYQQGIQPDEVIDIRKEAHAIFRKLGLEPRWVRSIQLTPKGAKVEVYLKNKDGQKYVEYEGAGPATEMRLYSVIA